ncbi:MAG: hypothetical protein ACLFUS_14045 [Candidatus Sumerlaeia bacterium]
MVNIGDTFLIDALGSHLFIIISDPQQDPENIVLANFTSWESRKDQSCIVEATEHPFLSHKSCIYYRERRTLSIKQFEASVKIGAIIPKEAVSPELLNRIHKGASVSPFLPLNSKKILEDQGLI